jgi:hypothetical protein
MQGAPLTIEVDLDIPRRDIDIVQFLAGPSGESRRPHVLNAHVDDIGSDGHLPEHRPPVASQAGLVSYGGGVTTEGSLGVLASMPPVGSVLPATQGMSPMLPSHGTIFALASALTSPGALPANPRESALYSAWSPVPRRLPERGSDPQWLPARQCLLCWQATAG